jgi:hypothetical protein
MIKATMRIKKNTCVVFMFIMSAGLPGCVNVPVWERGNLAKPHMALDPYPLQSAVRSHNYNSREAAASTHSGDGGGGCGCY